MGTTSEVKRWLKRHWQECPGEEEAAPVQRWELDYPSESRETLFSASGRIVQGWVLLDDDQTERLSELRIIAQWESVYKLCHPLEIERPDVIERVLAVEPGEHPQRRCGFRFSIPPRVRNFQLYLAMEGQRWLLQDVVIAEETVANPTALKVLEGKAGWLFLDNDTNGSVDQYRGRLLLTDEGVAGWQQYLAGFHSLARQHDAKEAVLVAPSKESVMGPRYHLFEEGKGGPVSQLLSLPEASHFIYPVPELLALGDDAFIQTDTHWTQQGAMAAAKALAFALGLDKAAVEKVFTADKYQERKLTGDLGSKFSPERQCTINALRSFNYNTHRHFDNGLPNFGRLLVLAYEKALMPGTCLVFGSSSSYSMFNYLSRLFKRVVFVHSAGSLDPELMAAVKPDYLVVQTNARFVVQVPKTEQSLSALIADKRERLTEEEREVVAKRQVLVAKDNVTLTALGLSPWVGL